MIVPQRNARLAHPDLIVRNELVRRVGHMSLPIDPRVVHGICTELAQLDVDGSTLQAGVSPLPTRRRGPAGTAGKTAGKAVDKAARKVAGNGAGDRAQRGSVRTRPRARSLPDC